MSLDELRQLFGDSTGVFYRVLKPKTSIQILEDLNTSVHTLTTSTDTYIRADSVVVHQDYEKIIS